MLTNIVPKRSVIHIAGREYRVRYSLNALLCLEMSYKPFEEIVANDIWSWTVEDILQLTRAALVELPQNRKATIKRDWDSVKPDVFNADDMQVIDLRRLRIELLDAISESLPTVAVGQKSAESGINGLKLRAIYCDVLGRPQKEFWTSTLKEISERIDAYFDVKGYNNDVIHVEQYDNEGM